MSFGLFGCANDLNSSRLQGSSKEINPKVVEAISSLETSVKRLAESVREHAHELSQLRASKGGDPTLRELLASRDVTIARLERLENVHAREITDLKEILVSLRSAVRGGTSAVNDLSQPISRVVEAIDRHREVIPSEPPYANFLLRFDALNTGVTEFSNSLRESRKSSISDPPVIISILAAFIGMLALLTSIHHGMATRNHNRLSVAPHILVRTHLRPTEPMGIFFTNNGVGPAKLDSVVLVVDKKQRFIWNDLDQIDAAKKYLGLDKYTSEASTFTEGADLVPAEGKRRVLSFAQYVSQPSAHRILEDALRRTHMEIRYSSLYGKSFTSG